MPTWSSSHLARSTSTRVIDSSPTSWCEPPDRPARSRPCRPEIGAAVYVQPEVSIESVQQGIIDLGFLVGEAAAARQLVGEMTGESPSGKPAGGEARCPSSWIRASSSRSDRSLLGDLVRKANGQNIAGERLPGLGRSRSRTSPRPIPGCTWRPPTAARPRDLRANPALPVVKAVRSGNVHVVPVALVTRPGPRVGEALEEVARGPASDAFR